MTATRDQLVEAAEDALRDACCNCIEYATDAEGDDCLYNHIDASWVMDGKVLGVAGSPHAIAAAVLDAVLPLIEGDPA